MPSSEVICVSVCENWYLFCYKGSKDGSVKHGGGNWHATRSRRITHINTVCIISHHWPTDSVIAPWRTLLGGLLHSNTSCINTSTTLPWSHVMKGNFVCLEMKLNAIWWILLGTNLEQMISKKKKSLWAWLLKATDQHLERACVSSLLCGSFSGFQPSRRGPSWWTNHAWKS